MKLRRNLFILLFLCTLFSLFSTISVYAADTVWVPTLSADKLDADPKNWAFYTSETCDSVSSITVKNLGDKLAEYHMKWFRDVGESIFVDTTIPTFNVKYYLEKTSDSSQKKETEKTFNFLEVDAAGLFTYSETDYKVTGMDITLELKESETVTKTYIFKARPGSGNTKDNGKKMFNCLIDSSLRGTLAGSIEYGYNIGIPYSLTQRPISDLMELQGNGYEFKSVSSIAYTFGYFYHPFFGNMYLNKETYLPTKNLASKQSAETGETLDKEDLWLKLIKDKKSSIFKNNNVEISTEFINFVNNLSADNVNEQGYKLTEVKIENGATRFNGVASSKEPKNVLSYNVPMAVPYIFGVTNETNARLATNNLRQIQDYIYCLYNDCIYDKDMNRVASMEFEVGVPREKIYLFFQYVVSDDTTAGSDPDTVKATTSKTGVALISVFDECVADYRENLPDKNANVPEYMQNIYLTGRKVGFDNGYSDSIDIRQKNVELLYVSGESGKKPYYPLNIMFPTDVDYRMASDFLGAISAEVAESYKDLTDELRSVLKYPIEVEFFEDLWDKKNHGEIPITNKAVKLYIDFGEVVNQSKVVKVKQDDGSGNIVEVEKMEKGASKYAFYCIRNNAYLGDSDLLDWLKTDKAKSITYVDAQKLIDLIEGNFQGKLTKLTYSDWKNMQDIKDELTYKKDTWLIRVLNVLSMIMGTILIIFAVLFMMAYWVDIFNTFSDVSILHFISFGNLYPVADKITESYLKNNMANTKFVTFKDVVILAIIMIACGILFLNTFTLINFIVHVFNYLMFLFGGV